MLAECTNGARTVSALRELRPSLVLLDAQMPDPGAFAIVAEVGTEAMPSTLFVTDFDRRLLRAFEVHAINYLLLPLNEERFRPTLANALRQSEDKALAGVRRRLGRMLAADEAGSRERRIPVRNAGQKHFVDLDDIRWVEGFGSLARLHLDDRTHVVKADLGELAERFADDFVRVHSILVRTSEIAEIEQTGDGGSVVKFRDGGQLRVSPGQRPQLVGLSDQVAARP